MTKKIETTRIKDVGKGRNMEIILKPLSFYNLKKIVVSSLFQLLNVFLRRDTQKIYEKKFAEELGSKFTALHKYVYHLKHYLDTFTARHQNKGVIHSCRLLSKCIKCRNTD